MIHFHEITIRCPHCSQENSLALWDNGGEYTCWNCQKRLIEAHRVITGYVYVLSNEAMPGLLKIGYSERPVEERTKELGSHPSVAKPFFIEAYFGSDNPERDEKRVHFALSEYRLEGREFFRIEVTRAVELMGRVLGCKPRYLCEYLEMEPKSG